MIYSKTHKFLFIHIPKTGGTSVQHALRPYATPLPDGTPPEQYLARHKRKYTAAYLKEWLGEEEWNRVHKFAVVRNPYDWFVSICYFNSGKGQSDPAEKEPMRRFIHGLDEPGGEKKWSLKEWVCDEAGEVMLDRLLRFETLHEECMDLASHLGVRIELEHRLPSKRKPYPYYYDSGMKRIVESIYKDEMELFDYRYGLAPKDYWQWFLKRSWPEITQKIAIRTRLRRLLHFKSHSL